MSRNVLTTFCRFIWKVGMLLFFFIPLTTLAAQEKRMVHGVVHSVDKSIYGASVILTSVTDSAIIAFGYTDDHGNFQIPFDATFSTVILTVRYLGYKIYSKTIQTENLEHLDILLESDAHQLREVVVKAPKVWGNRDTINYNVARLTQTGDRSIGDVIRHIPGIRILNGKIEYQGKPLKSVHIEGLDLTQGNYGMITNNVDASDITTIQILDNYQGIRSLIGKRSSDEVVINLKISSKKRGIWGGGVDAGLGYGDDLLTHSRIKGTYFTRSSQFLASSFVDNTGRLNYGNIRNAGEKSELKDLNVFANVVKPSTPHLPSSYYLDNISHYTNGNSVFTLRDSSRLYLQGNFRVDKIYSDGSTYSQYESKDSLIVLDEHIHRMLKRLGFMGGISYEKNLQRYYLLDRLSVNTDHDKVTGIVNLNATQHPQHKRFSSIELSNQLHYINSFHSVPIELLLTQSVNTTHETFETTNKTQLTNLFSSELVNEHLIQCGKLTTVRSSNQMQIPYIHLVQYWRYLPSLSLSYQYQNLSSTLLYENNSVHDNTMRATVIQVFSYLRANTSFDLVLPLSYQLRHTSQDKLCGLLFEPSAKYKVTMGDHWSSDLSGIIKYQEPSINSLYPFMTLDNYRSVTSGNSQLYRELVTKATGMITYQNIFSFFSSYLKINYNNIKKPFVVMESLTENGGSYELKFCKHHAQNLLMIWSVSKGFTWWGLGVDFDLGYLYGKDLMAFQGKIVPYVNRLKYAKIAVKAAPVKSIQIDYDVYWGKNFVKGQIQKYNKDEQFYQTARLGFTLSRKLYWDFVLDHTFIHSDVETSHSTLMNTELTWKLPEIDIRLELNNILNAKDYKSIMRLSYATIQNSYQLRQRSVLLKLSFKI